VLPTIGIIGAGVMGTGLALDAANHGLRAIVCDRAPGQLDRCAAQVRIDGRLYRLLGIESTADPLARIRFSADPSALTGADFVVECVTESMDAKADALGAADRHCRAGVAIASTTSAIPIGKLAACTGRPAHVLGLHFMNPVPVQTSVEMIRGPRTSAETIAEGHRICAALGKTAIVVADSPGFVSNRVTMLAINEAAALHGEGVATAERIDAIFTQCLHHKMGPLATADLIGLDTVVLTLQVLQQELDVRKYAPSRTLTELVAAGKLGRKSGEGFYSYELR